MKRGIVFVLLILGVVLMNSPPVMDQDYTTDDLEMVTSINIHQDCGIIATMNMEVSAQGGVILQTYNATWSATIYEEISEQCENRYDYKQTSWVEPTKEGPMRLELYSKPTTWRIQETYM